MADSWDPVIHESCFVCKGAVIEGPVRMGAGSVVHPRAELRAIGGPLVVGEYCIFGDECKIINPIDDASAEDVTMALGSHNVFAERCRVVGAQMGSANEVGAAASLEHCALGSGCRVGPTCEVGPGVTVDDHVALSATSAGPLRRVSTDPEAVADRRVAVEELSALLRSKDGLSRFHVNVAADAAAGK